MKSPYDKRFARMVLLAALSALIAFVGLNFLCWMGLRTAGLWWGIIWGVPFAISVILATVVYASTLGGVAKQREES